MGNHCCGPNHSIRNEMFSEKPSRNLIFDNSATKSSKIKPLKSSMPYDHFF